MEHNLIYDNAFIKTCQKWSLNCAICFDPYLQPQLIAKCQHVFCKACINGLKNCPECRILITQQDYQLDRHKNALIAMLWAKHLKKLKPATLSLTPTACNDPTKQNGIQVEANTRSLTIRDDKVELSSTYVLNGGKLLAGANSLSLHDCQCNDVTCMGTLSLKSSSSIGNAYLLSKENQVVIDCTDSTIRNNVYISSPTPSDDNILVLILGVGKIGGNIIFESGSKGEIILSPDIILGAGQGLTGIE